MECFPYTCMPPIISVMQKAIIVELLTATAEAMESGTGSTALGDTQCSVEFNPSHDPFRWMTRYKSNN